MKSILIISDLSIEPRSTIASNPSLPAAKLAACGYHTFYTRHRHSIKQHLDDSHAAVLHLPLVEVKRWSEFLLRDSTIPVLWWCSPAVSALSPADSKFDAQIDGILTPTMNKQELHWALRFGAKMNADRRMWQKERQVLKEKIAERRWIELAKGILCKIKNLTEAEAYELMRKQAMNERRRLVDVAASIVKVSRILEDQK